MFSFKISRGNFDLKPKTRTVQTKETCLFDHIDFDELKLTKLILYLVN